VSKALFAERFTVPPVSEAEYWPRSRYDELRGYNVTTDGRPYVEIAIVGSTTTVTMVAAEPHDDDRDWARVVGSIDTVTRAQSDTDRWSL
jgi:hypothetical protein